jgi:acetoin utilization deacetylase AcuC-like enzyme
VKIVYSDRHRLHATATQVTGCAFTYREIPERAEQIIRAIAEAGWGDIHPPADYGISPLLRVHTPDYIDYLQKAYAMRQAFMGDDHPLVAEAFSVRTARRKPTTYPGINGWYAYDNAAPILADTWGAIYQAAQCAVTAAEMVREGAPVAYALCRPPGHHAAQDLAGGYCYVNNGAVATRHLQQAQFKRVAIIDIDFHHGNGTQEIFYEDPTVLYVSMHADTEQEYPFFWGSPTETGAGAGQGFNLNYPLPDDTTDAAYIATLERALDSVRTFAPSALVLSVGFDLMQGDPEVLGLGFAITLEGLASIATRLAALDLPTVVVQEGGYNLERLGDYASTFLTAFLK